MKLKAVVLFVSLVAGLAGCGGPQTPPPAAPSELRGAPMGGGFHLYWKDNSEDEDEFVVESRVDEGAFTELASVPFNTTQYMVSSGQQGRRYSFRVVARGAADSSSPSNEITWTP
jgi:hypothetical protein